MRPFKLGRPKVPCGRCPDRDSLVQRELPFSGNATQITYEIAGRQYVVIASSGSRNPKGPQGSAYMAFALPR